MLRSLKDLESYGITATDGPIGEVSDFYFDDDSWALRYLVVATGGWLAGRKVLISPLAVRRADWADRALQVALTKAQVKNSPDIDTDKPVSRQNEIDQLAYYGYPSYWGGAGLWGDGMAPYAMLPDFPGYGASQAERDQELQAYARIAAERHKNDDPHLRSARAVVGYNIHASDGEIGHVDSLLVDEDTWAIRYLVINTSNWWMGQQVLVSPSWINSVRWADESVTVGLSREAIRSAPVFESTETLNREREASLYGHHQRPGYWTSGGLPPISG